jgi:hypothetical protein
LYGGFVFAKQSNQPKQRHSNKARSVLGQKPTNLTHQYAYQYKIKPLEQKSTKAVDGSAFT